MPRIVHMTTVHTWNDGRIYARMCRSLASAGYDTHLIAPDAPDAVQDAVVLHGAAAAGRRLRRMTSGIRAAYRLARDLRPDLCHFHDPELIPAGALLARRGRRVIYDVHEDLPRDILTKSWIPGPLRPSVSIGAAAIEAAGSRRFSAIVTATGAIARRFPPRKTSVIQNYPLRDELLATDACPHAGRPPLLAYVGGISRIRGIGQVARAMALLNGCGARLVLAGRFEPPDLEAEVAELAADGAVEFVGWRSRDQVRSLLASARAGIVTFLPVPNHVEAQPNKLFEYMAAGLPVIASDFPLWREIVDTAQCGLLVDPEDPAAISAAITWVLKHPEEAEEMGRRGRAAVEQQYHWEREAPKLIGLYRELLGS